tara:strand:+ start:1003 stop:2859 length:1857 start_codon:yes stop_codon:yes gene_type:complete
MKRKKITLDVQNIIIVIIYFSIIFFNGGVYTKVNVGGLNSYFDLIPIGFYLISPIICSYVLLNYFNKQIFTLSIHPLSIFIGAFVFLFILINNLNHQNLYSDEFYYTFASFKVVNALIQSLKIDDIGLFSGLSYSTFLRISIGVLWIGSFLFLKYIFKNQINIKKNSFFYISLFILKLILILINTRSDVHPPLNYFPASIFIVIFGMNIMSIKSSIIFVNVLFIIYLYNRLKLSEISTVFISIFIFSMPVFKNFSIYFDQSIYSMFCFSVIIIEIFYKKTKPKYLILIISIFSLFRYSSIAAYPAAFIYCFMYYNQKTIGWRNRARKFLKSLTPILLSIPVIIFPILLGTPTTDKLYNIDINNAEILQFHGSLTEDIFLTYGVLLLIPLVCFTLLLFLKNAQILIYIFTIYLSYHFIFSVSAGVENPKYLLEQIGFVYIFSITFLISKFYNQKKITNYLRLSFLVFLIFILSNYNFKEFTTQSNYHKSYGHYFRSNSQNYIVDYIKSNNLYDQSLLIGIDYGPMLFGLYKTTLVDFKKYANNWYQYVLLKKSNGIDFGTLELDLVNQLENIKYLFITDYSFDYNQDKIKKFINNDKWKIIGKIEKTNNFSEFYILKKS